MHSGKNPHCVSKPAGSLLPKHVQVIESLHVHEVVIHGKKIRHANDRRNQDVPDCLTHRYLPPQEIKISPLFSSAGALDAGKPIEEPQTHGAGNIENHLPYLHLQLAVRYCCRRHRAVPSLNRILIESFTILDTLKTGMLMEFSCRHHIT
jgi:hypothetical protein